MLRFALVLLPLVACIPELSKRPVQFAAPTHDTDPLDDIQRALVTQGLSITNTDPRLGIVQTRWENTGFGYGFVDIASPVRHTVGAQIWRRYSVVVARHDSTADVTVRADVQRCAEGSTTPDGVYIDGACTTMFADGLVPDHQAQLDALGEQLKTALHGG